jgi:hypothetical protein
MFTWVALSHCSWFAELSTSARVRSKVLLIGELANCLVALPVGLANILWKPNDLPAFRVYVALLAILTAVAFVSAGCYLQSQFTQSTRLVKTSASSASDRTTLVSDEATDGGITTRSRLPSVVDASFELESASPLPATSAPQVLTLGQFAAQILRHRNFWAFVFVNFLQVYQSSFHSNFYALFDSTLLRGNLSTGFRGTLLGLTDFVAPIVTVLCSPLAGIRGSYDIVLYLFVLKFVLGCIVAGLFVANGSTLSAIVLGLWMFISRTLTAATFTFFNMSVSDVIDEDCVLNSRKEPMSSMFFGTNALLTKPAQSLAPIITYYLLAQSGYKETIPGKEPVDWQSNHALCLNMLQQSIGLPLWVRCSSSASVHSFFASRFSLLVV